MDRTTGHQINRALHFKFYVVLSTVLLIGSAQSAGEQFVIAQVQYGGGGDWYGDQTTISNWLKILRARTDIEAAEERVIVKLTDRNLYQYPMLYIVGHGNIRFTKKEVEALRFYLTHGGFLFVNDDYGLDESFRREIRRVFPDQSLQPIPNSHLIYHCFYDFPNGLPKIHEHDGEPAQGFGLFHKGRMVVLLRLQFGHWGWSGGSEGPSQRYAAGSRTCCKDGGQYCGLCPDTLNEKGTKEWR